MTEEEWLACADPVAMLTFLDFGRHPAQMAAPGAATRRFLSCFITNSGNHRRLRLLGAACARQLWATMEDQRSRTAVELSELFVDRLVTWDEVSAARSRAREAARTAERRAARQADRMAVATQQKSVAAWVAFWSSSISLQSTIPRVAQAMTTMTESLRMVCLVHEVFGNPFRPVAWDPAWRTPTVLALARTTYEERALPGGTLDNARLAILADALEEAGCENAAFLQHLRSGGDHVRGCWAIDPFLEIPGSRGQAP
jgi:hypothetical protein